MNEDRVYSKNVVFSERKPSFVSQAITTSQFDEEIQNRDLVLFLRGKVNSLEKELESQFLKHKRLIESIEKGKDRDRPDEFKKGVELNHLKKENGYLKKALIWKKQEMDLFESKFRAFSIKMGKCLHSK